MRLFFSGFPGKNFFLPAPLFRGRRPFFFLPLNTLYIIRFSPFQTSFRKKIVLRKVFLPECGISKERKAVSLFSCRLPQLCGRSPRRLPFSRAHNCPSARGMPDIRLISGIKKCAPESGARAIQFSRKAWAHRHAHHSHKNNRNNKHFDFFCASWRGRNNR